MKGILEIHSNIFEEELYYFLSTTALKKCSFTTAVISVFTVDEIQKKILYRRYCSVNDLQSKAKSKHDKIAVFKKKVEFYPKFWSFQNSFLVCQNLIFGHNKKLVGGKCSFEKTLLKINWKSWLNWATTF